MVLCIIQALCIISSPYVNSNWSYGPETGNLLIITIDKCDVHAKGQGKRSKVKVTEVKTNYALIWSFPDHNSSLNSQMVTKWCI